MASRYNNSPQKRDGQNDGGVELVPFETAEEAWFWFVQAQEARNDGARFVSGQGACPRPCEPVDILKSVDRLYRNRRLLWDHVLVLRHYGVRRMAPDPRRVKESRAYDVWSEALERLEEVLVRKGIVRQRSWLENAQAQICDIMAAE